MFKPLRNIYFIFLTGLLVFSFLSVPEVGAWSVMDDPVSTVYLSNLPSYYERENYIAFDSSGNFYITDGSYIVKLNSAKEFVSLAAHQLRTPITAIMWNLEIAEPELKGKVSKDIYESVLTSYQQADNMSNLVNQFLNVSRIDLGKFSVNPEPLDLASTLKEVLSEQEMVAKKKKQAFTVKVEKGIPIIPLDKVLIRIVLQNLISNAIKYTPEEGKVTITLKKQNQNALFTVKDSGIGIPEAQQKNLFNKLFRAQNAVSSGQEGNGLGLYIVKSIVQLMKGTIEFTSAENKGTTFTVEIPYKGMEKKEGTRELMEVPS